MKAVYEPKGRAAEYCDLAANLYAGCGHRCGYCYMPAIRHQTVDTFGCAAPRLGIIQALEAELPGYWGREVLLCFSCDPYQPIEAEHGLTRRTLELMRDADVIPRILTKASLARRDFDLIRQAHGIFGMTLTFITPEKSRHWEPGAAPPEDRFETLRLAKAAGIATWASLEPVIDPAETLAIIERTHGYVDHYKVGTLNHRAEAREIDWPVFARAVKAKLESLGAAYYLKADLRRWLA